MRVFQIIGQPGAGKTTLVVDLVTQLVRSGITVGTLKHSSHAHELDKPGKDSFRHRTAGAVPAAMMTRDMAAVYLPRENGLTTDALLKRFFTGLDLVLIEGWIRGPYPKIEIWREAVGKPPLFKTVPGVTALSSDGQPPPDICLAAREKGLIFFLRQDIQGLTRYMLDDPEDLS